MLNFKLLAKLIDKVQQFFISIYLCFTYINTFNVLTKFDRAVNLQLFISHNHCRWHLKRLRCAECCFQLIIIHFANYFESEFQRGNTSVSAAWVLISKSAPISDMRFEQKVRGAIAFGTINTFGIIGKIDHSVFNPLKIRSLTVTLIKHPILPRCSRSPWQWSWTLICLKLIPVMCVFHKKFHMFADMNLNDNRGVVLNVVGKIFEIFTWVSQFVDFLLELFPGCFVLFYGLFVHVLDCFCLEGCHSGEGWLDVSLPLFFPLAVFCVEGKLCSADFLVTVVATHCCWLSTKTKKSNGLLE